jgi:hypothetical protein
MYSFCKAGRRPSPPALAAAAAVQQSDVLKTVLKLLLDLLHDLLFIFQKIVLSPSRPFLVGQRAVFHQPWQQRPQQRKPTFESPAIGRGSEQTLIVEKHLSVHFELDRQSFPPAFQAAAYNRVDRHAKEVEFFRDFRTCLKVLRDFERVKRIHRRHR